MSFQTLLRLSMLFACWLISNVSGLAQTQKPLSNENRTEQDPSTRIEQLREDARFADAMQKAKRLIARETEQSGIESDRVKELTAIHDELRALQNYVDRVAELNRKQEFEEAASVASRVLALELAHYGADHPKFSECRMWRDSIEQRYQQQRKSWAGIESRIQDGYRRKNQTDVIGWTVSLLKSKRRSLGNDHTEVAKTLLKLAAREEADGRAETAVTRYADAIKILTSVLGTDHSRVAEAKLDFRTAKATSRLRREAQKKVIDIKVRATDLFQVSTPSKLPSAVQQLSSDLLFIEKNLGTQNSHYLFVQIVIGEVYRKLGRLADADRALQESTDRASELAGKSHFLFYTSLSRWAIVRGQLSDHPAAIGYAREATEIAENLFNPCSDEYLTQLHIMASLEYYAGNLQKTIDDLEKLRSLHLLERGADHAETGVILSDLAHGYLDTHRPELARKTAADAIEKVLKFQGREHPRYLSILNLLAMLEDGAGKTEEARMHFEELIDISRRLYGENHPAHVEFATGAAAHFQFHGDLERALEILERAIDQQRKHLDDSFIAQSERHQLEKLSTLRGPLFAYVTICVEEGQQESKVYDHLSRWKGSVSQQQSISSSVVRDSKFDKLRKELQRTAARLSSLIYGAHSSGGNRIEQEALQKDWRRLGDLEQQLASHASQSSPANRQSHAPLESLLPENAAFVDFYVYNHLISDPNEQLINFRPEQRLLAFVFRSHQPIRMVQLGAVDEIRELNQQWRRKLQSGRGGSPINLSGSSSLPQMQLRERLWQSLEPLLEGIELLLICPDGPLNELPLAALPGREPGQYLIEQYGIVTLPSKHWLVENSEKPGTLELKNPSMLLVGDIDFGQGVQSDTHGARMAGAQFTPLPGTAKEIDQLGKLFESEFHNGRLTVREKESATESLIREEVVSNQFVHFATHGFFVLENQGLIETESQTDQGIDLIAYLEKYVPELLSGIALAGANVSGSSEQSTNSQQDGILTALELSVLDLNKVELAVLSACETSLGQQKAGEGMLRLQRALQVAGAKTALTSLWKVDDKATQVLMTEFYKNLWQNRLSRVEALRQAQLEVLDRYDPKQQNLRPRGLSLLKSEQPRTERLSPYYWAPFSLSGEWR